ncbi:MAG: glycosyltransferase family 61 protein [Alphaproteobacteria bacterium]|nr:glycosyltransferase family 61 protein [Alphaproteobacteria bacterium]
MERLTGKTLTFPSRLLTVSEWATAGGGTLIRHPLVRPMDPTGAIGRACVGSWRAAYDLLAKTYDGGSWLVEGKNARVLLWKWRLPNGGVEELFLTFARDGGLLCEDPFWLPFYPLLRPTERPEQMTVMAPEPEMEHFTGEYVFFGGKSNWGHWLIDWLSNAHFLENHAELDGKTLVVNKMTAWQRETLRHLGIDRQFLELDVEGMCGLYTFDSLWVIHGHPLPARADYIRRRLARPAREKRKRVYLSRATMAPLHRVENEDEVQALFRARSFEIVYPEKLSLTEKIDLLGGAEIVATPPGSASVNYLLFTGDHAVNVNFAPSFMRENTPLNWVIGGMSYVVPRMDRTIVVYGERAAGLPAEASIDIAETYPPQAVAAAVDVAEAMLA